MDAFTKYIQLVALPNKEATTISSAIFKHCQFGVPVDLITDQGKEFCTRVSKDLFKRLGVAHLKITAEHPQCNSQAKVANKMITKYLASFLDKSTLDWEPYLYPHMFSYNTSFHQSTQNTTFFLKFEIDAQQPDLPSPELQRKFYRDSSTDEMMQRLLFDRDVTR
jgi:hypothetical protein